MTEAPDNPQLVAAKVMLPHADLIQSSKLPNVRERFRREARNGQVLTHPNIVRYLDSGQTEKNPFLIMELADRSVADQLGQSDPVPEEGGCRDCGVLCRGTQIPSRGRDAHIEI